MPVEIKELIIRAVVEEDREAREDSTQVSAPGEDKNAIVEACVKQVLRILKKGKER